MMKRNYSGFFGALAVFLALAKVSAWAEVKLPAIFGDHMVLQRDTTVPIWGTASPGEAVTVTAGTATASTKAGQDGKWIVRLAGLKSSATPIQVSVAATNTITFQDVLVGDVWVCSGQSNMAFGLANSSTAKDDLPKANRPDIRLFAVKRQVSFTPQADCQGAWVLCTPETAKGFSAVGYYFGREIADTEKVPVGLIGSNVGGTPAQAWTSLDGLESDPALKKAYADAFAQFSSNLDAIKAAHDQWLANGGSAYMDELTKWRMASYAAKQKGTPEPAGPPKPATPEPPQPDSTGTPTVLYNGMIAPLMPFAIKGVIWYQGESNGGNALYAPLFPAMIVDWRKHWGQGDFPFLFVQLPNYRPRVATPVDDNSGWAHAREDQLMGLKLPNTGMAVTIDVGDGNNLHPPYKAEVGHRLALAAEHVAYGADIVYSGPIFDSFKIDGNKVRLTFKNVGKGLKIGTPPVMPPGATPPPTNELSGFAIAAADHHFVAGHATIESPNSIVVSSDAVSAPADVRYGWADNPEVNLYNSGDLPASPFRTDVPAAAP